MQPKLTGKSEGKVNVFNRAATRYLITIPRGLLPFLHFSPNVGRSLAGEWSSSVWKLACCVRNGHVETDTLIRFNRTDMLIHDPFKTRFGRSS